MCNNQEPVMQTAKLLVSINCINIITINKDFYFIFVTKH